MVNFLTIYLIYIFYCFRNSDAHTPIWNSLYMLRRERSTFKCQWFLQNVKRHAVCRLSVFLVTVYIFGSSTTMETIFHEKVYVYNVFRFIRFI